MWVRFINIVIDMNEVAAFNEFEGEVEIVMKSGQVFCVCATLDEVAGYIKQCTHAVIATN